MCEGLAEMQAFFFALLPVNIRSKDYPHPLLAVTRPVDRYITMNSAQIKCLSVFSVFAIIGFGPVSPGCLIGMYIVMMRPEWFLRLTGNLYNNPPAFDSIVTAQQTKSIRIKSFLSLLTLFIIDIAPVPVTPVIAFFIILGRPHWFYRIVKNVYGEAA